MSTASVPVIEIGRLDKSATLRHLDAACRDWGFFQVVGHGIDRKVLDAVHRAMQAFFQRPLAEKNRIARTHENHWGFYDRELTKNVLDWKEIFDYGPAAGDSLQPQWPANLPAFKRAVLDYYRAGEALSRRLLAAIASNLDTPAKDLHRGFGPENTSFVRLNYYPVCPQEANPDTLGISPHTDAGALTCLLQDDRPGLEVLRAGSWHLIEPHEDALVINIGDIVQVWSNDRYRAAFHRVITDCTRVRYSAPFFFNPSYATDYQPLPALVDANNPARYRPINWGEFRARRAAGDYADYGEEIQISKYLIRGGGG